MGTRNYHLAELNIARSSDDPRRAMPSIPVHCQRVLDIGCGAGQTLIASDLGPDVAAFGVDLDFDSLQLGRELDARIHFICAVGEHLPFPNGSFDFVVSRVTLPLMHVPRALVEIGRVLRPNGTIWLVLHTFYYARRRLVKGLRSLNVKEILFQFYVITNSLLLHFAGKQFSFPLKRGVCESFQTVTGIRRLLRASGFGRIEVRKEKFLVVTAAKETGR